MTDRSGFTVDWNGRVFCVPGPLAWSIVVAVGIWIGVLHGTFIKWVTS